jgi:hypothetical protein
MALNKEKWKPFNLLPLKIRPSYIQQSDFLTKIIIKWPQ